MKPSQRLRACFLGLSLAISFAGLLAISFALPDKQKKPPAFPLNLFQQASAEDYIDDGMCAECHKTAHQSFGRSPHALYVQNPRNPADKRGCQACHGPGGVHTAHLKEDVYQFVVSYTKSKPAESAAACLRCHNDTITQTHWRRTGHARANLSCVSCHQMHWPDRLGKDRTKPPEDDDKQTPRVGQGVARHAQSPIYAAQPEPKALLKASEAVLCGQCHRQESAEFRRNFHHPVPEGRMVCSSCHELHPTRDNRNRFQTSKQSCITCHAEVAGPFVHEHDPVSDLNGQGCMECHRPHGSQNPKLLTTFSRGLCKQCHTDKSNNHFPGRSCWQAGCHVGVHGSNRDRLLFRP